MNSRSIILDAVSKSYKKKSPLKIIFGIDDGAQLGATVLNNINLTITKGEVVGIVGRNGSGKSTLLQLIAGILKPDSGKVIASGRVAALIELGAGLNQDYTGVENIYLLGALLGLDKNYISKRFDLIVSFSELDEKINDPVSTYSSGMAMRLAFAIYSQVDPDILIIDEALSVGDAKFQLKCFDRLEKLKKNNVTILMVTHSIDQILTHCTRAILLEEGRVIVDGDVKEVANKYSEMLFGQTKSETSQSEISHAVNSLGQNGEDLFSTRVGFNKGEYRYGDFRSKILDFQIESSGRLGQVVFYSREPIKFTFKVQLESLTDNYVIGLSIKKHDGQLVWGTNSEMHKIELANMVKVNSLVTFEVSQQLIAGDYFVSVGLVIKKQDDLIVCDRRYDSIHIQIAETEMSYGIANFMSKINGVIQNG